MPCLQSANYIYTTSKTVYNKLLRTLNALFLIDRNNPQIPIIINYKKAMVIGMSKLQESINNFDEGNPTEEMVENIYDDISDLECIAIEVDEKIYGLEIMSTY